MFKWLPQWLKMTRFLVIIIIVLCIVFIRYGLYWVLDYAFPLSITPVNSATLVYAKDHTLLWKFPNKQGMWCYPVTLDQVSPYYIDALLTFEDRQFYHHHGINYASLGRAVWQVLTYHHIISGGSTLTMQTARLVAPSSHTLYGKVIQIFHALQLEHTYTKSQILTMYLNRAPFGGTIEGVGAASWLYFNKPPDQLNYNEAALLAALPQSPSHYRPDRHLLPAQQARNKVIERMVMFKHWDHDESDLLKKEPIVLSHEYVAHLAPIFARRMANQRPSSMITTTLDSHLQRSLERLIKNWRPKLSNGVSLGIVIVDSTDMSVQAYVGSADFYDATRAGQVDMVTAWRSPGSTLKPFLYGLALDQGLIDSASLLQDIPRIKTDYRPHNFDTGFRGPVSAQDALVRSLNLPAVQLLSFYDPQRFVDHLKQAGVNLLFPSHAAPTLPLILGGTAVKLDNLVAAYSAFARHGYVAQLRYTNSQPLVEHQLLSRGSAWIVRRILGRQRPNDVNDRLTPIAPFAWKTGTSYGYRDAWAVGLTGRYLIGVLVASPNAATVAGMYANHVAVPLLQQIRMLVDDFAMKHNHLSPEDRRPDSVSVKHVCWPQGLPLSSDDQNCLQQKVAWVLNGITPQTLADTPYQGNFSPWLTIWVNHHGLRVAADCADAKPRQLALWPPRIESWVPVSQRLITRLPPVDASCPPIGEQIATPLVIVGVENQQILTPLPLQKQIDLHLSVVGSIGESTWFINGKYVAGHGQGLQQVDQVITHSGHYQVVVIDEVGQRAVVNFSVKSLS